MKSLKMFESFNSVLGLMKLTYQKICTFLDLIFAFCCTDYKNVNILT